jgi:hypothetical protein
VTCWIILILSNLTLRREILCQMFSSWWNSREACATCAKSAHSCCLVLKILKFRLYLVLNEKFQYSDLKAPRCVPYPIVWLSARSRDHLRKIMSNRMILKIRGVCRTQLCDPSHGLQIIWGFKMSKLLNLIDYLLSCLLTCTNGVLSCICESLAKQPSQIIVAHHEMICLIYICSSFLISMSLCLWWPCSNCYIA